MAVNYVIDRPTSECRPDMVNVGPTLTESWMYPDRVQAPKEDALLKRWAQDDLGRYYRELRSNRY